MITFENELNMLPKECSTVVELKEGKGRLFNKNDTKGSAIDFIPNEKLNADPELLCKKLSNVYLDSVSDSFKLPSMITFLNLFGVGKIEHLNVRTR